MDKLKVLISSMGSNTAIGVSKSLRKIDSVEIVGIDINDPHMCPGYTFADHLIQSPNANSKSYSEFLIDVIERYGVNCVIPIYDREIEIISILSQKYPDLTHWAVNQESVVNICNDKKQINSLLKDQILVPTQYESVEEAQLPYIIKPNKGVGSKDVFVVRESDQNVSFRKDQSNFVQDYIEGKEYTIDCYSSYNNPNVFRYSVRERIETKSGMSTKGIIRDISKLGEYCKTIHHLLKYQGVSNMQFIENDGDFYFIEINPRFAGGGILTYSSGLNFPLYTVLELTKNLDPEEIKMAKLSMGNQMVRYYSETFFNADNHHI